MLEFLNVFQRRNSLPAEYWQSAGHFARVSFHGEGRAECRAECRVHLLFRAECRGHLLFRVQSRVPCAPSLAEQSAVCTFFSLLPVDLTALLWSVGFFSGAVFFARITLARSAFLFQIGVKKAAKTCKSCRSRQELSNEYLVYYLH